MTEGDRVAAEKRLPGLKGAGIRNIVASLNSDVQCIEQGALVFEMPVKRWLLDAEPLRQRPRGQSVNAGLVQQVERRVDNA